MDCYCYSATYRTSTGQHKRWSGGMPSIFARVRTTSTKTVTKQQLNSPDAAIDEFGRVSSRGAPPLPLKDKRSQSLSQPKRATHASAQDYELETDVEDGFFPTSLASNQGEPAGREYGLWSLSFPKRLLSSFSHRSWSISE